GGANEGRARDPLAGQNNRATTQHHPCVLNVSSLECRVRCGRHQHYRACRRPRSRPAREPDTEIPDQVVFVTIGLWRGSLVGRQANKLAGIFAKGETNQSSQYFATTAAGNRKGPQSSKSKFLLDSLPHRS